MFLKFFPVHLLIWNKYKNEEGKKVNVNFLKNHSTLFLKHEVSTYKYIIQLEKNKKKTYIFYSLGFSF